MAKYDVHRDPGGNGFLLDVQADLLDRLNTRVVVPLLPEPAAPTAATRLNPVLTVAGADYVMVTQFLAAVPASVLGAPVANLSDSFAEITGALDMLFQGF